MQIVRSVLILIFLHLYFFTSGQEVSIYKEGDHYGLRDAEGQIILEAKYDLIGWSDGSSQFFEGVTGYRKNGFWGILTDRGKEVTNPLYKKLEAPGGRFIIAATPGRFSRIPLHGLLDRRGRVVTSFRYDHISYVSDKQYIVTESVGSRKKKGVLIPDSGFILDPEFREIKYIKPGRYLTRSFNGFYGVADRDGVRIIPNIYEKICLTDSDHFRVQKDGFTGEIDQNGEITIPVTAKTVTDNRLRKFPLWTIRDDNNHIRKTIEADSIKPAGKDRLLLYRNHRTVIDAGQLMRAANFRDEVVLHILENAVVVRSNAGVEVKKPDGTARIVGAFDSVFFDQDFFYTRDLKEKSWQLYSRGGTKLSQLPADEILPAAGGAIRFKKRGFWGVMDFDGSIMVNPKYDTILPFVNRNAVVGKLGLWGVLTDQNQWLILPYEESLHRLGDSLFVAKKGYHIRFFNAAGHAIKSITTSYRELDNGSDFIAIRGETGKEGLMDPDGNMVMPIAYDSIRRLQGSSFFKVSIDSLSGIVRATDRIVVPLSMRLGRVIGISEGMIGLQLDGKYGFVDEGGLLLIANRYDEVKLFSDGLAAYRLNGKWGFLNKKETLVIQPAYEEVLPFRKGVTAVRDGAKWGLIDRAGRVLEPFKYDHIKRLPGGKYLLVTEKGTGLNDENGNSIFLPVYQSITDLENGSAIVVKNGKWGVLDYRGSYLIPTLYEQIKYDRSGDQFFVKESPAGK